MSKNMASGLTTYCNFKESLGKDKSRGAIFGELQLSVFLRGSLQTIISNIEREALSLSIKNGQTYEIRIVGLFKFKLIFKYILPF
jgi:hypothetical protein